MIRKDHKNNKNKMPIEERHKVISMISANLCRLGEAQKTVVLENLREVTSGLDEIESLKIISSITQYIYKDDNFTDRFINDPIATVKSMDIENYVGQKYVNRFIVDDSRRIFKIIGNLSLLHEEGYKPHQVNLVLFEIDRDKQLRDKFIDQPLETVNEIGLRPW